MNRFRRCTIAIELLASLALGSACVASPFREMIVFGDSLSDTGNAATRYRERIFPPPYAAGRWSNGPMWVEVLADRLGLPRPVDSSQGGTNYAWGGGTTGTIAGLGVSMQAQVQSYLRSRTPLEDELFVILGGVNDFFRGQNDPLAPARKLVELITRLRDAGARNFLVGNLPETVGIYPSLNQALARNVPAFNAELWSSLDQLASSTEGLRITKFDFHGLYGEIAANPAAYGLANVEQPACIECGAWDGRQNPSGFVFGNVVPNPDEYYLWDDVHPSAAAHRLMGEAAFAALVPEPCTAAILAVALLPPLLGRSHSRVAATRKRRRLGSSAGPCLALGGLCSGCRRVLLALVMFVLLIASPSMSVAARYSGIVAFGDSITDVGNWAIHAGLPSGVFPPQYAGGRGIHFPGGVAPGYKKGS